MDLIRNKNVYKKFLKFIYFQIGNHVSDVIKIYENIYKKLSEQSSKSYIGLRDFYSLIKYLRYIASTRKSAISDHDVVTGMNIVFFKTKVAISAFLFLK